MSDSSQAPAGYCPKCGYRMDAGTCSECGLAVTAATLAKRPPHVGRRRRRIAFVLVALAISGYVVFQQVNWMPLLPNRVLLALHGDAHDRMTRELLTRHAAGGLSSNASDRLFRSLLSKCEFDVRSPYPVGYDLQPIIRLQTFDNTVTMAVTWRNWRIAVDGSELPVPLGGSATQGASLHNVWLPKLSALSPGEHAVAASGSLVISTSKPPASHRLGIDLRNTLVVEDRPIEDYVTPVWSEELAAGFVERSYFVASVHPTWGSSARQLEFSFDEPPVSIAFDVMVRTVEGGEFQRIGVAFAPKGEKHSTAMNLSSKYPTTSVLDVLLVPSKDVALTRGLSEYFDGELRWDRAPFVEGSDVRSSFPPPPTNRPTAVTQRTAP